MAIGTAENSSNATQRAEYVDLRSLARFLWRKKWIIGSLTLISFLYGLYDLRGFEPKFIAEMTIAPVEGGPSISSGGGGAFPQLFNLLATGEQQSSLDRLKVTIASNSFATLMDEKYGLLRKVYAGSWDVETGAWVRPEGFKFELRERLRKELRLPAWAAPSVSTLAEYLRSAIVFQPIGLTQFSTVQFISEDADFAKKLLADAIAEADTQLRERDVESLARDRAYILDKLATVRQEDLRNVLFDMLRTAEGKVMLAERTGGYAIEVILPVYIKDVMPTPDIPSKVLLPTLVVFFLSVVALGVWALVREE